MRVTGGIVKGQQLRVPKNCRIRPTTDMVREAIFAILGHIVPEWSRVLDLYAGSGALGIEALSRNAQWTDFVERDVQCCAIIKQNLGKTGLTQKAHVYCCPVAKALTFLSNEYTVIFSDPPYSDPSLNSLVLQLANSKSVGEGSFVVIFHTSHFPLDSVYGRLSLIKERKYGDTTISIYQKEIIS